MNPKNWYKDCSDSIRAEFGTDADLFIDLLAATSPRKQISANWRLAMRIYHVWKTQYNWVWKISGIFPSSDNLMQGTLPAHRPNIIRALCRQPLQGNKVRAFAANLKGDYEQVTIDVWMCRYFNHKGTLSDKQYKEYADSIRHTAKAAKYKPAEWQAIIWHKMIEQSGKKPRSYLNAKDRNQMFFEFYF